MTALDYTPLPESRGSRLPPPPPVKTTFAGAGDEGDPSERILTDQAFRLIRSLDKIEPGALPSHLKSLRRMRQRVEEELAHVRLIDATQAWTIWLPVVDQRMSPQDAQSMLVVVLGAIDESIGATEQRMRDLFVPFFASELM